MNYNWFVPGADIGLLFSFLLLYGEMLIQRKYMIKEGKRGIRRQIMSPFMSSERN